jgi:hypothetical protein
MEKTAVEWFYEEIWKQFGFSCSSNILEQAKEMHKQQIIDAYLDGFCDNDIGLREPEQYYTKTFKQD